MNDAALLSSWFTGLAVAAVLVVVAAALLIAIWLAARRILRLALQALDRVNQIKANTNCIWALKDTNQTANGILKEAESIRDHGGLVAKTLHRADDENVA